MRLKYETAIATLIQFVSLSLLTVANALDSIVSGCTNHNQDCVSNMIVSIIFFIIVSLWFGAVWLLGLAAQSKRSKRLAQLLIIAELMIALIAFFNAKHHTDWLSLGTSLIDLGLAVWIITLSWRLMKSDGGRIVANQRVRQRRLKS